METTLLTRSKRALELFRDDVRNFLPNVQQKPRIDAYIETSAVRRLHGFSLGGGGRAIGVLFSQLF